MDDLTSVPAESTASDTPPTGQADQTSQETSQTPQVQSETAQSTAVPIPPGYVKEEDFKGLQRQLSQTLSTVQQRAYAAEQALLEARMAGMDDLEKAEFRAQALEAQLQQRYEQDQVQDLLQKRAAKIYEVASKFKVPVEVIQNAQSPDEMYEMAIAYKDSQVETLATKRAAEVKELQEHSKVDLGSGSYTNPFEKRRSDALKNKSASDYVAALMEK